ncbi:MAG: hypothetical protein RDU14_17000 [Melioribacteraceae bacterium]|nr:hypothetical protein [Melioribacteraceae bacterium]
MSTHDELKLNDHTYIINKLGLGKSEAKTYDKLYVEYKNEGGWLAKSSFTRKARELCVIAQRNGIKLCRDSDCGLYLFKTDKEWEDYKESEQSRANNIIKNIALCENKTVPQQVREWFLERKKTKAADGEDLTLFESE